MAQITINEGLAWAQDAEEAHDGLLALRNDNAHRERRFYAASAGKEIVGFRDVARRWPALSTGSGPRTKSASSWGDPAVGATRHSERDRRDL